MYISKNNLKDRQGERLFTQDEKKEVSIYGYIPKKIVYDEEIKSNNYNYYVEVLDLPNLGLTIDPIMGNGVETVHKKRKENNIVKLIAKGIQDKKSPASVKKWSSVVGKIKSSIKIKVKPKFKINQVKTEVKENYGGSEFGSGSKSMRSLTAREKNKGNYMVRDTFAKFNYSKTTRLTNDVSGVTSGSFFNSRFQTLGSGKKGEEEPNYYDIDLSSSKKGKTANFKIFGESSIFSKNNQSQNLKNKVRFARGESANDRIKGYSVRSSNSILGSSSRRKSKNWRSSSTVVRNAVKRAQMRIRGRGGLKKPKTQKKKAPEKLADFLTYTKLDEECNLFRPIHPMLPRITLSNIL